MSLEPEAQLLRLSASQPSYRLPKLTQEVYLEAFRKVDAQDLEAAVTYLIEHSEGRFPQVAHVLKKAKEFRHARLTAQDAPRSLEGPCVEIGSPEARRLWRERYEAGRRAAEARLPL